jgi:hypothetical protein
MTVLPVPVGRSDDTLGQASRGDDDCGIACIRAWHFGERLEEIEPTQRAIIRLLNPPKTVSKTCSVADGTLPRLYRLLARQRHGDGRAISHLV